MWRRRFASAFSTRAEPAYQEYYPEPLSYMQPQPYSRPSRSPRKTVPWSNYGHSGQVHEPQYQNSQEYYPEPQSANRYGRMNEPQYQPFQEYPGSNVPRQSNNRPNRSRGRRTRVSRPAEDLYHQQPQYQSPQQFYPSDNENSGWMGYQESYPDPVLNDSGPYGGMGQQQQPPYQSHEQPFPNGRGVSWAEAGRPGRSPQQPQNQRDQQSHPNFMSNEQTRFRSRESPVAWSDVRVKVEKGRPSDVSFHSQQPNRSDERVDPESVIIEVEQS